MEKTKFLANYILKSLTRDYQRSILAIVCITFGVLSLVSMQTLSDQITKTVMKNPRESLQGDYQLNKMTSHFNEEDFKYLDTLKSEGKIKDYTYKSRIFASFLQDVKTKTTYNVNSIEGIQTDKYPAVGTLKIKSNKSLDELLSGKNTVVISGDLNTKLGLKVGDKINLFGRTITKKSEFVITGIAEKTPAMLGQTVYMKLDTMREFLGRDNIISIVSVQTDKDLSQEFASHGYLVTTKNDVVKSNKNVNDVFGFMLKGAGVLGLMIGGIGIANTLQVILARRLKEIAILKTLGYKRNHLITIFIVETIILGLIGSILGTAIGVLLGREFMYLFAKTGTAIFSFQLDPIIIISGLLVGVSTSVIFGVLTIFNVSQVRPVTLLRNLPIKTNWKSKLINVLLVCLLLGLFITLAAIVLKNFLVAVGVVIGGIVILFILGIIFSLTLKGFLLIPFPAPHVLKLSKKNLKRSSLQSAYAMVALFIGVTVIGLSANIIYSGVKRLPVLTNSENTYNVVIYANPDNSQEIVNTLKDKNVNDIHLVNILPVKLSQKQVNGESVVILDGRNAEDFDWQYGIMPGGKQFGTQKNGVYLPQYELQAEGNNEPDKWKIGDTFGIVDSTGNVVNLTVAGFYNAKLVNTIDENEIDWVTNIEDLKAINKNSISTKVVAKANIDDIESIKSRLLKKDSNLMILTILDMFNIYNEVLFGLFAFVISVASLALLAGAVLIANVVGLSIIYRKKDFAILKSVGFRRTDVLATILAEYSWLGIFSGIAGIGAVKVIIELLNWQQPSAKLVYNIPIMLAMVIVSMAIAMLTTYIVSWNSIKRKPMETLREE